MKNSVNKIEYFVLFRCCDATLVPLVDRIVGHLKEADAIKIWAEDDQGKRAQKYELYNHMLELYLESKEKEIKSIVGPYVIGGRMVLSGKEYTQTIARDSMATVFIDMLSKVNSLVNGQSFRLSNFNYTTTLDPPYGKLEKEINILGFKHKPTKFANQLH
ncbi:hypothetical protein PPL_11065 [Heterostelium album PN500]|uniref:Uncharacterized protein n=1 Tax=Heterostelium pallidum (strain ATCC 26659 / Pp 5 / PN500) TaxID=670386 RepID=D3BSU5_HETP5|nr:hypothetical protein PPL_11065 [Heterostelium album PN500]EFA75560.1 hypothetical protein PPL_11065 [Heterostelium album PN500]|eukprot:XP_020427694.1 hypothetical protein PPL_11065 [Heterostelium album PN500]